MAKTINKELPIGKLGKLIRKFDYDKFEISEYEYGILIHSYNQSDTIIRPTNIHPYAVLKGYMDALEDYKTHDKETQNLIDHWGTRISFLVAAPSLGLMDDELMIDISDYIIQRVDKYINDNLEKIENVQPESPEENVAFQQAMESAEELKRLINETD